MKRLSVLFSRHNTDRSQMAEAFLRHFTQGTIEAVSAGTITADRARSWSRGSYARSRDAWPKLLTSEMSARSYRIIRMGCDVEGVLRIDDDWGLPDPKDQPPERAREIRKMVREKAGQLVQALKAE